MIDEQLGIEEVVTAEALTEAEAEAELADGELAEVELADGELALDGLPVLARVRAIERYAPLPAMQAAAVAAGGFVAGAATLALVKRHSAKKATRAGGRRGGRGEMPIAGTTSFLVDVHFIGRPAR